MERANPVPLDALNALPAGSGSLRDRAIGIIAFATVLALLYFGRDVLIPFTVALMLSLLIAPLVRRMRRIGFGRVPSILAAVLISTFVVAAAAGVLGTQVLRTAASLPQYERNIQQKLGNLDEMTLGRVNDLTSEAGRLIDGRSMNAGSSVPAPASPIQLRLNCWYARSGNRDWMHGMFRSRISMRNQGRPAQIPPP